MIRAARFHRGEWVLVRDPKCGGRKNFVGEIVVVDRMGGGIYAGVETSYDLQGWFEGEDESVLLKHIADSDVEPCDSELARKWCEAASAQ